VAAADVVYLLGGNRRRDARAVGIWISAAPIMGIGNPGLKSRETKFRVVPNAKLTTSTDGQERIDSARLYLFEELILAWRAADIRPVAGCIGILGNGRNGHLSPVRKLRCPFLH
jgi:hypothetical protein